MELWDSGKPVSRLTVPTLARSALRSVFSDARTESDHSDGLVSRYANLD